MSTPQRPQNQPQPHPGGNPMSNQYPQPQYQPNIIVNTTANASVNGRRKKTAHLLHLILTICTGGLWGIVWIICYVRNNRN